MSFSKRQGTQQKNKQNNRKNGGPRRMEAGGDYVGAPYNFVPFYDRVYEYPKEKLTAHNEMEDGLITGELSYEISAKTPIMVDDGQGNFCRDAQGRYAIPGSTMRGLIRSHVQILGLCGYGDDIGDDRLMYRNVAAGAEKKRYNEILGVSNDGRRGRSGSTLSHVRAGYVANEGGAYRIYKTAADSGKNNSQGMNYYALSEKKIIEDYLKYGDKFSYGFFRQCGRNILQHEFREFRCEVKRGRKSDTGVENKSYAPYYKPVSYEVAHGKDVTGVGMPGVYENEGYAVSSGRMKGKKAVYIIPEIDRAGACITIPEEDVRAFRNDLNKRENTLKSFGGRACFDLPEEGGMRPVFYIQSGGRLYFGFTPRLRLLYDHTIREGLSPRVRDGGIDYARALFGYADEAGSYRSKLSFSDAVALGDAEPGEEQRLILAEPKPSSYLDYLRQDPGGVVTYNSDSFFLRGAKQYWLHESPAPAKTGANGKIVSSMRPLKAGVKFAGKIRFQNLRKDELGLLLWAVRLNDGSQMNVGRAKAYGYGRISVSIREAKRVDLRRAYDTEQGLALNPFRELDIDDAIRCYKDGMKKYLGKPIDALPHIREFFMMKDSDNMPDQRKTAYMELGDYRSRVRDHVPLPTVSEIMKP